MSNLLKENKSGWEVMSPEDKDNAYVFADDYIKFMNSSKTEREVIKTSESLAKENGFKNFNEVNELHPGDKVYYINREKNIFLAVIGEDSIEDGFNLIGAHADSPRLDLKPNPLIEKGDFAYFLNYRLYICLGIYLLFFLSYYYNKTLQELHLYILSYHNYNNYLNNLIYLCT